MFEFLGGLFSAQNNSFEERVFRFAVESVNRQKIAKNVTFEAVIAKADVLSSYDNIKEGELRHSITL